jgi:hypothetical protein
LLARNQIDRSPVDILANDVDRCIAVDHAFSGAEVGIEQRLGGPRNRVADELGHFDELIGDRIKLVVVGVAHACSLPSAQALA